MKRYCECCQRETPHKLIEAYAEYSRLKCLECGIHTLVTNKALPLVRYESQLALAWLLVIVAIGAILIGIGEMYFATH